MRYALRERRGGSDRFFESGEGRPLTTSGLRQVCERIGERAGVHVAPHKLRYTFAISYLRNGASVFAVQKMLGHATLDVTLRYAAMVTDDLVNEHREHSPVAHLGTHSQRKRGWGGADVGWEVMRVVTVSRRFGESSPRGLTWEKFEIRV